MVSLTKVMFVPNNNFVIDDSWSTLPSKGDSSAVSAQLGCDFFKRISTPTFDFGKVAISSNTQQHGLKQAADYYENGQENPYLRLKKSQPNWALTAEPFS
jgi:hypothetical protein